MTTIALSAPVAVDWRLQARLDRALAREARILEIDDRGIRSDVPLAALTAIVAEVRAS